ncbi:MAG: GNAT family N-acetyltransferase [bacterium]|nr:GNAT family N-acetyltransferase [bacterium]
MAQDFQSRQATAADVPALRSLQEQWAAEDITYGFVPADADAIEDALRSYAFVAEADGQVIGFVTASCATSEGTAVVASGERYIELDDLFVVPEWRSGNVGGALVELVLEAAREEGVRKALVYSATKDVRRVLAFYERHGFRSWYVQMVADL